MIMLKQNLTMHLLDEPGPCFIESAFHLSSSPFLIYISLLEFLISTTRRQAFEHKSELLARSRAETLLFVASSDRGALSPRTPSFIVVYRILLLNAFFCACHPVQLLWRWLFCLPFLSFPVVLICQEMPTIR
jgi:hypothetical protein